MPWIKLHRKDFAEKTFDQMLQELNRPYKNKWAKIEEIKIYTCTETKVKYKKEAL